ncbi:hypothetical protein [Microcoleus sp. CAWBG640]|uniref:hypothetical protein n=1 Tax=Microcoleus sp. CAWBG640 TaxID=2841653 RepID=UPI00312B6978
MMKLSLRVRFGYNHRQNTNGYNHPQNGHGGHANPNWCQLNVQPIVRQGFKPLPQSESPLKED